MSQQQMSHRQPLQRKAIAAFVWASVLPVGSVAAHCPDCGSTASSGFSEQDQRLLRGWYATRLPDSVDATLNAALQPGRPIPGALWAQHHPLPEALTYSLGEQPRGTMLVRIGDHAVRVAALDMTVIDSLPLAG